MTKISTLIYIIDNTNIEENVEIAGKILDSEYTDVEDWLKNAMIKPSNQLIEKVIQLIR